MEQRIKEDVESDEYLSWAVVKQRPILLRENTRCVSMSHYEYKFWLDMTDIKTGYIKKQGKGNGYLGVECKMPNIFKCLKADVLGGRLVSEK